MAKILIEPKPFWKPWLVELLQETYQGKSYAEHPGDLKQLNSLDEKSYARFEECRKGMLELYDSGEGAMTIEEMQTYTGPHISKTLYKKQPYNGFRAVYRALYNTLEVWVWS